MTNENYRFRQDLYDFIEELRTKKYSVSQIRAAMRLVPQILKQEKHSLYFLTKPAKLILDKSLFKPIYKFKEPILLEISPFDFQLLVTEYAHFDRLVMVDKKKNLLKQVGGIALTPLRPNLKFHVIYRKILGPSQENPLFTKKEIDLSKNMKVIKMSDSDLEFMQDVMAKIRTAIDQLPKAGE